MKTCPYCAEQIQDKAIVCRYCGRDLLPVVEKEAVSGKLNITKSVEDVEEYLSLIEAWAASYSKNPGNFKESMLLSINSILELLTPVFIRFLKANFIDDEEHRKVLASISNFASQWAILCFYIGVEHGRKNIVSEKVPYFLYAVSKPMDGLLISITAGAAQKGILESDFYERWVSELSKLLTQKSTDLANAGFVGGLAMDSQSIKSSSFISALTNIIRVE